MKKFLFTLFSVLFFTVSCGETVKLTQENAEVLIKDRLAKMPGRSVSFYLGAMTDPSYVPVYKAVATGKYLTFKPDVYVEAAGRKMPMFEATEEGRKIFKCDKNRCTAEVCSTRFKAFKAIVNQGEFATVTYDVETVCEGELYDIFKPLAERQYIRPSVNEERSEFEYSREKKEWFIK